MKRLIILISILFAFQSVNAQYNNLRVGDPRNSWWTKQGSIDEAVVTLKPHGLFIEYGLYLTFSSEGTGFDGTDTLEVVMDFVLPEEAMIIDSWLWVGEDISKGILMDRWTASQIYEDIVDRRKDPSILTKNSAVQYELRVFPMAGDQTRKVKISYLLPMVLGRERFKVELPWNIFETSYQNLPFIDLIVWDDENMKGIEFDYESPIEIIELSDNYLGDYQYAQIPKNSNLDIMFDSPLTDGYFYGTYPIDDENGYYQLGVLPGMNIENHQNHKLAIMVDLEKENCHCDANQVLNQLKDNLMEFLSPRDSFNLFLAGLQTGVYSDAWVPATEENINQAIVYGKEKLANYSNLVPLLQTGLAFLNNNYFGQGESAILISNASQYSNYLTANDLLDDIMEMRQFDYKINVLDFQSKNYEYSWIGGVNYCGNEYFFTNLAHVSYGDFIKIRGSLHTSVFDLMDELIDNLNGVIDHFELDVRLENGYTFGHFELGANKANYINDAIVKVGRYHGNGPVQIELNGSFNEEFFNVQILVDSEDVQEMDENLKTIWGGLDLEKLQNEYHQTNDIRAQIIQKSLDLNILSRYTAFLCLEDTRQYCDGCIDETELVDVEEMAEMGDDSLMYVFPNPFQDVLNIHLDPTMTESDDWEIHITDVSGQIIKRFDTNVYRLENDSVVRWHANQEGVKSGVYFIKVRIGMRSDVKKAVKLE